MSETLSCATELAAELVYRISSTTSCEKLDAVKALRTLSERSPGQVYPHFEYFVKLLHNPNSVLRWNGMLILGNLAPVDHDRKLDAILDEYLAPISGPQMIDAANTMKGAAVIALAKTYLADRVAREILTVAKARYQTPECGNVAIGHAIEALERIFPAITVKAAVKRFVSSQTANTRSGTRKKAEKFLRKYSGAAWHPNAAGSSGNAQPRIKVQSSHG